MKAKVSLALLLVVILTVGVSAGRACCASGQAARAEAGPPGAAPAAGWRAAGPSELNYIYLPLAARSHSRFDFRKQLFDPPTTLSLSIEGIDPGTGWVEINGVDTQQPSIPFTWDWGDGTIVNGWFPQQHTYTDLGRSYNVRVTSHYSGGGSDLCEVLVRFVPPVVAPVALPPELAVTIPDHEVPLGTRLYPIPPDLTYFGDSFFDLTPRAAVEYVLSVAAAIQDTITNGDRYAFEGGFRQVVLRAPSFWGMYSLWYTDPPSFASGDYGFLGTVQYASFMHEMGHNFSLNSPAGFYYGGRIDGNANAIFSEAVANIYAHTTAYQILNNPAGYGLGSDLETEIKQGAIASMQVTRAAYEDYIATGMSFHSWNDPATPADETFDTFMTIAYKFCAHAEQANGGYLAPAKRMMALLQLFDQELLDQYDPGHDTPEADTFRATLMVAALSHGFSSDLRAEFEGLGFPISDAIYDDLMGQIAP